MKQLCDCLQRAAPKCEDQYGEKKKVLFENLAIDYGSLKWGY